MPYALSLECELTHRTKRSHCETPRGQNFHNHLARIVGDINYSWYWLWWPCTKHAHRISYPCLASRTSYECLLKEVTTQMLNVHWMRLARKERNEWGSCHNPNSKTYYVSLTNNFECKHLIIDWTLLSNVEGCDAKEENNHDKSGNNGCDWGSKGPWWTFLSKEVDFFHWGVISPSKKESNNSMKVQNGRIFEN